MLYGAFVKRRELATIARSQISQLALAEMQLPYSKVDLQSRDGPPRASQKSIKKYAM